MDKITEIIEFIKKNNDSLSIENLNINIQEKLIIELKRHILKLSDIDFLIDLTIQNITLSTDIIKDIFENSKKKIDHKVILSNTDQVVIDNTNVSNKNMYNTLFLNILSTYGQIHMKPDKIVLLWNDNTKIKNINSTTKSNLFDASNIFTSDKEIAINSKNSNTYTEDGTRIIIKYVNYNILTPESNTTMYNKEKIFNNYKRRFGLKQYDNGFKTKYQLNLPIESDYFYTSVTTFYKGNVVVYFNDRFKTFTLKTREDLVKIIDYYQEDLLTFFKKRPDVFLKNLYLFYASDIVPAKYTNNFLLSLSGTSFTFPKKEYVDFIEVEVPEKENENSFLLNIEPCTHEQILDSYLSDRENYFNNVNKFIEEYVDYKNGLAVCKLCNENIVALNIKEALYVDKTKFIVNINDNSLNYAPYNKFSDAKYYFENFFYLFSYHTKLTLIGNNDSVIRISLDNFIFLSSKRLEFEAKYKNEIKNNNIFLLRLSNNFFEVDTEKERYQTKKNMFSYFLIAIITMIFLPLRDINEFIFYKKKINLAKTKKQLDTVTFEDVIVLFLNYFFKHLKMEYYPDSTETEKLKRLAITLEIYKDLFNEETLVLFNNKKHFVEDDFKNKNKIKYELDLGRTEISKDLDHGQKYNSLGQYQLNLKTFASLEEDKKLQEFRKKNPRNIYNMVKPNSFETTKVKTTTDLNPQQIENINTIVINFKDFNFENFKEHKLLNNLGNEFSSMSHYKYFNYIVKIQPISDDMYLIHNDKVSFIKESLNMNIIKTVNNTKEFNFFIFTDYLVYKTNISLFEFTDLLHNYIIFLEMFFKVKIKSNVNKYFLYDKEPETFFTRSILFFYKIELLLLLKDHLKIKYNIYDRFDKLYDNEEISLYTKDYLY